MATGGNASPTSATAVPATITQLQWDEMVAKVEALELQLVDVTGPKDVQKHKLILPKNFMPEKLRKEESWRTWRESFLDYCELTIPGMRRELERARVEKEEITSSYFDADAFMWGLRHQLYMFLKQYTEACHIKLWRWSVTTMAGKPSVNYSSSASRRYRCAAAEH